MRSLVSIGAVAAGVACGFGSAFVCEEDTECNDGGLAGVCQPGGDCSFPDAACESGQRYGQHVGGGLAGQCVPPGNASGSSEGGTLVTSTSVADESSLDDVTSMPPTTDTADADTSTGPTPVDDTGVSTGDDGSNESTGEPGEPDPDLVLWLMFDDPQAPFADKSIYARSVSCEAAADSCPAVAPDGGMDFAATFDGTNDYLQVPHDAALETDQGLTVSARVRNDAVSSLGIHTVIARPYSTVTENAWELFFRDETGDGMNDVVFEIADLGGQLQAFATATTAKGEWTRITAIWTGGTIALYFDGVLQTEVVSTGMLLDPSPIVIGGDFDNLAPANWFLGAVDDVRVYRRVLSEPEIAALP